jgi:DNA-directed RNA polymerase subunit RPC12/RpoP
MVELLYNLVSRINVHPLMSKSLNFTSYSCDRCDKEENHSIIIHDHKSGDILCGKCGYVVLSRIIDHTPDWAENVGHSNLSGSASALDQDHTETIFVGGKLAFCFFIVDKC